jgi:uncharacterized protein (DUF58 family)
MAKSSTERSAQAATSVEKAILRARGKPWRRYFRTTREGKAFIGVTGGVGLAAINTGNNLLFLIFGFMLSLIVLSGILSEIVLRRLRVTRRLPERAFAGSACLVELVLANEKLRAPTYSLEIEDIAHGLPIERRCYFLKVAARSEQVAGYRRTVRHRGPLAFVGFRVATRYPFGIIEKWRFIEATDELLIYPALLAEDLAEQGSRGAGADVSTNRIGSGGDLAGIRQYQAGDAARSIHWRRTAALGEVMVYEKHVDASTHLTLMLDNARPQDAGAEWDVAFERAISRAAAIVLNSTGRDASAEVVCRGQRSPIIAAGSDADPILRFLALLQSVPAQGAPAFGPVGRHARVVEVPVIIGKQAA